MRLIILCILVLCALCETKDLTVGTRVNNLLINTEKLVVNSLPFIRREKTYNYTDPKQRIIKVNQNVQQRKAIRIKSRLD